MVQKRFVINEKELSKEDILKLFEETIQRNLMKSHEYQEEDMSAEIRQFRKPTSWDKWKSFLGFMLILTSLLSSALILFGFDLTTPQTTKKALFKSDSAQIDSIKFLRSAINDLNSKFLIMNEKQDLLLWMGCSKVTEAYLKSRCSNFNAPIR